MDLDPSTVSGFLDAISCPRLLSLQSSAPFATPSDAYAMLIEMIRQYVPPQKQQMLVQARGQGTTLESALSVDFVFSLAMAELRDMLHLPPAEGRS
jgi:hypothetical protein